MKTMTQLQAELRAAAEHIENLSRELAQLQPSGQKKALDFTHIQTIGKRYPIQDHCLVRMDADFQRQYLTLLTAPLLLESREPENGWLFLQRILCGAGCTLHLADLQADAAALTEQQLDTFSAAVLERGLADALMLDGMLLCLSSKGGNAMQDWLSALAELLGRTLPQIRELSELAALIAQENQEGLRAFTQRDLIFSLSPMKCHILPILKWYAQTIGSVYYLYGDGETAQNGDIINCHEISKSNQRIEIRNMIFSRSPIIWGSFDALSILLERCKIQNITNHGQGFVKDAIYISSKVSLEIKECQFRHLYGEHSVNFSSCESLRIEESYFEDLHGIIWFPYCNIKNVIIENARNKNNTGAWYQGSGGTATPDCYYKNCKGEARNIPNGLKEKKEA